jgi:hypothetical protein
MAPYRSPKPFHFENTFRPQTNLALGQICPKLTCRAVADCLRLPFTFPGRALIFRFVKQLLARTSYGQKSPDFLPETNLFQTEVTMRITRLIFIVSLLVCAAGSAPSLAKNSSLNSHANANAEKVDEQPAAQGCHAYQQGSDGSWVELSCQEGGRTVQAPVRGRSATRIPDQQAR